MIQEFHPVAGSLPQAFHQPGLPEYAAQFGRLPWKKAPRKKKWLASVRELSVRVRKLPWRMEWRFLSIPGEWHQVWLPESLPQPERWLGQARAEELLAWKVFASEWSEPKERPPLANPARRFQELLPLEIPHFVQLRVQVLKARAPG
jgi:hypothetical protein